MVSLGMREVVQFPPFYQVGFEGNLEPLFCGELREFGRATVLDGERSVRPCALPLSFLYLC